MIYVKIVFFLEKRNSSKIETKRKITRNGDIKKRK